MKTGVEISGSRQLNSELQDLIRKALISKYYELTPKETKPLTDLERPQFFEDSKGNLWLGLHGSGLALFNRKRISLNFSGMILRMPIQSHQILSIA